MSSKDHWQNVYSERLPGEVSWYRLHLEHSLELIRSCQLKPDARIVDVGGGASTLADDLLDDGYQNVAVIDLADAALAAARSRLGERSKSVDWIVGDATTSLLPRHSVNFWHDARCFTS